MILSKDKCALHLSEAIQFKTISYADKSKYDFEEFHKLHEYLFKTFPLLFSKATVEVINKGSLLIHLKGDSDLLPVLFMAHLDVVSIVPNTEPDWVYPPFSGAIADGFVWGRGSLDTKCMVLGELEAIENLLANGFINHRDIYFAYGHDEETAGGMGQYQISRLLKERGIRFEYVIDEGSTLVNADLYGAPNIKISPVGVFEKGYADITLEVFSKGGHSSNPGKGSSLGLLCKAIGEIENHQFKAYLPEALRITFKKLVPYITKEPLKTYVMDIDKYEQELIDYCYNDSRLNPYVHTTIATTMLEGGSKGANVLPQNCKALINLRTSELDSLDDCINHFKKYAYDCEVTLVNGLEPSMTSKTESPVLGKIEALLNQYEKCVVVPVLLCGGTDCRFYDDLSECCYRFGPFIYDEELGDTVHGTNERMPIDAYYQGIQVFIDLIKETC